MTYPERSRDPVFSHSKFSVIYVKRPNCTNYSESVTFFNTSDIENTGVTTFNRYTSVSHRILIFYTQSVVDRLIFQRDKI